MNFIFSRYDATRTYAGQKKFDCGNAAINKFVIDNLKKQVAKDLSAAFVLQDADNADRFIGFYTSMMSSIAADGLRDQGYGSLPGRVPCMRLVMLGIDSAYQGKQLGRQLLQHAITCMIQAAKHVGVFGLYLDADAKAVDFYLKHGFVMLEARQDPNPTPMFLHIHTARMALAARPD
jgi:GNAT superfamily N-acetyltransferase